MVEAGRGRQSGTLVYIMLHPQAVITVPSFVLITIFYVLVWSFEDVLPMRVVCDRRHEHKCRGGIQDGNEQHLCAEGGGAPLCHAQSEPQEPPQSQMDPVRDVAH